MLQNPRMTGYPDFQRIVLGACLALLPLAGSAQVASAPADAAPAPARDRVPAYATGDAWLDGRLADIDLYAARHPQAFADELERHAGVPRGYALGLLAQPGWGAGDVWYACFLGRIVEATCRSVVRGRSRAGADATWADVATEFGAPSGSPAYAALRLALADSYRRWDRPLQADTALNRALRERQQRQALDAATR